MAVAKNPKVTVNFFKKLSYGIKIHTIVVRCAIWYHLVQFKKRGKHPWRSVNFTKMNTLPWVLFFTFFKLYQWYQVAQRISYKLEKKFFAVATFEGL